MNEGLESLMIVSNASYSNYYSAMFAAESDARLETAGMDYVPLPESIRALSDANRSIRLGLGSITASFAMLGFMSKDATGAMGMVRDAMAASIIASGVYSALRSLSMAKQAWEETQAAIEATAAMAAQNWYALALAGGAFAATYAAFSMVGSQSSVAATADISTPQGRRTAQAVLRGVANG